MEKTTKQSRSVLMNQPDEMAAAYNAFAVAVKNFRKNPTKENQDALDAAQKEVYRVEDLYRDGRGALLTAAQERAPKWKR